MFKPVGHVPYDEWVSITERAEQAKRFKESFLCAMITHDMEEAKNKLLTSAFDERHTVHYQAASLTQDSSGISFLPEQIRQVFVKPRSVTHDELVGQFGYMNAILKEADFWIEKKIKMDKEEADGLIIVDREQNE